MSDNEVVVDIDVAALDVGVAALEAGLIATGVNSGSPVEMRELRVSDIEKAHTRLRFCETGIECVIPLVASSSMIDGSDLRATHHDIIIRPTRNSRIRRDAPRKLAFEHCDAVSVIL